jgi:UDP-N-acetylmuramate-alanine ligase
MIGHAAENLGDAAVVVTSTAVKRDNPEVVAALEGTASRSSAVPKCWPN